jgi:hypothetical protein
MNSWELYRTELFCACIVNMVGFAKPMDFKPPVPITITTHNDVLLGERGGGDV